MKKEIFNIMAIVTAFYLSYKIIFYLLINI